jgi:hypothetical protein
VREAQEVERLRLAQAPCRPVAGGEPPELDQPGLTRVQLQPELREPPAQPGQEPLSVLLVLEPDDEVVRLCRAVDYAELPVNVLASAVAPGAGSA